MARTVDQTVDKDGVRYIRPPAVEMEINGRAKRGSGDAAATSSRSKTGHRPSTYRSECLVHLIRAAIRKEGLGTPERWHCRSCSVVVKRTSMSGIANSLRGADELREEVLFGSSAKCSPVTARANDRTNSISMSADSTWRSCALRIDVVRRELKRLARTRELPVLRTKKHEPNAYEEHPLARVSIEALRYACDTARTACFLEGTPGTRSMPCHLTSARRLCFVHAARIQSGIGGFG